MKVTGQLKDGSTFSHENVMRVDDYQGCITIHGIDGTPKGNWKRSEIADINVDFGIPKPEISLLKSTRIPGGEELRKIRLDD